MPRSRFFLSHSLLVALTRRRASNLPRFARRQALCLSAVVSVISLVLPASTAIAQQSSGRGHSLGIRLGANLTPNAGPALGLDYTLANKSQSTSSTRITLDGIFASRTDGLQRTSEPVTILTLDQVVQKPGSSSYAGGGIGVYSGPFGTQTGVGLLGPTFKNTTDVGGKLFIGRDISSTFGLEGALHFTKHATLATVQVRLKL